MKKLSTQKATQYKDLVVKILKEHNSIIFWKLYLWFFQWLSTQGRFPVNFKNCKYSPVFKKGDRDLKDNYHPVSILPVILKIFEKLLCKQITMFIDPLLSKFQCGFRKGYGAQDCLLVMLEHWKSAVYKGKVLGLYLQTSRKPLAVYCMS